MTEDDIERSIFKLGTPEHGKIAVPFGASVGASRQHVAVFERFLVNEWLRFIDIEVAGRMDLPNLPPLSLVKIYIITEKGRARMVELGMAH